MYDCFFMKMGVVMEHCWNDKKHLCSAYEAVILAVVIFVCTIVVLIAEWKNQWMYFLLSLFLLCGVGAYLFLCFLGLLITVRKYAVSQHGLTIKYPLLKPFLYTWDQISEVSVCNVHYTRKGALRHEMVLRIAIGPEKNGPKQGLGNWSSWEYEFFHINNVITLRYSSSRMLQLEKLCPFGVTDYRSLKRYGSIPEW